ncbi:MAG TPA: biotin--[acetyl-CoA-carboxylase] ligase [Jatrophihabitans sp.]|jgi:BirA family biotin operon repressor/biotin-[acetyl-CoA-carboxylase] ligase|uniref:biotin--[acetyl-CoA-carboxylase] ligase n=1 Tax=Jatrophihabitans sp. TaxID=1932789 RepID=UPI002EF53F2E
MTRPAEQLRQPVDADAVTARLAGRWLVEAVAETGSTNADLLAAAAAGAAAGTVLVAELQTGGRGRLGRSWESPPGAGLTFSVLLRPAPPVSTWGWLPLLTGLALARALGSQARLKWPNDLLLGARGGKAAGILVQSGDGAVAVGVGLNVSTRQEELPVETATSLLLEGHRELDRAELLVGFLGRFDGVYTAWQAHGGDARSSGLADGYRAVCATLDSEVSVELGSHTLIGRAVDLDDGGRLLVQPAGGGAPVGVAAGDVTHLRGIIRER